MLVVASALVSVSSSFVAPVTTFGANTVVSTSSATPEGECRLSQPRMQFYEDEEFFDGPGGWSPRGWGNDYAGPRGVMRGMYRDRMMPPPYEEGYAFEEFGPMPYEDDMWRYEDRMGPRGGYGGGYRGGYGNRQLVGEILAEDTWARGGKPDPVRDAFSRRQRRWAGGVVDDGY